MCTGGSQKCIDGPHSVKYSKDDFLRLTHHAEGLYEGTGAEYVHVEVSFGQ